MVQTVGDATIAMDKGQPEQGETKAVGPTYRNIAAKEDWPTLPGATTLFESFERSVKNNPDAKCLGWRPITNGKAGDFEFMNYKQTHGAHWLPAETGCFSRLQRLATERIGSRGWS